MARPLEPWWRSWRSYPIDRGLRPPAPRAPSSDAQRLGPACRPARCGRRPGAGRWRWALPPSKGAAPRPGQQAWPSRIPAWRACSMLPSRADRRTPGWPPWAIESVLANRARRALRCWCRPARVAIALQLCASWPAVELRAKAGGGWGWRLQQEFARSQLPAAGWPVPPAQAGNPASAAASANDPRSCPSLLKAIRHLNQPRPPRSLARQHQRS